MLRTTGVDGLRAAVDALREWQHDGTPVQLHPGDVGWHWRFGAEATADAARTWTRDGRIVAVGMFDGPDLVRLGIAPDAQDDDELAGEMAADLMDPQHGVASVEARLAASLRKRLAAAGWRDDEPWTPLSRDLTEPVEDGGVRIEVVGPQQAALRAEVQRAAFDNSTFTEERWHTMAAGLPYADAQCLLAYDDRGDAVAAVTVWSAGPGRPGLLEPMGVHREHRGHGYGRAITLAAADALRRLGSSSAIVCTESSNVAGVATYTSAGFRQLPDVLDLRRGG